MADVQLSVDPRQVTGKKVKSLRRQGIIPAHLYGRGTDSLALQAAQQAVTHLLRTAGRNAIIDLQIGGEPQARPVVLRSVQRDPVSGELVHLDFFQVSLTEKMKVGVPLVLVGEAPAVSVFGGVMLQSLDHLNIEALPQDVPQHVEIDVSHLETVDSALFVRDLPIPAGVQVLDDPGLVVAKVAAPRLAVEVEKTPEEEEAAAAAAAAAGAEGAPAEAGAAEEKSE
ncbi:MAG: 50S ribosomal protein L25 [Dehalococcoidia bacterium]